MMNFTLIRMWRYYFFLSLAFLLLVGFSLPAQAKLDLSPSTQEDLLGILKGLAKDHAYKQWCETNCGQIHSFQLSGTIQSGTLQLDVKGNIVGRDNGVLPLFGSVPAIDITLLRNNGDEVPLVFLDKSFYTLLAPGPFHLTATVKVDRTAATNFNLPGSVGQVILDITDQEPLLKSVKKGQVGGSFQVVSQSKLSEHDDSKKQSLRLDILREFTVGRDKHFEYRIKVVGAQVGQVISIPLQHQEQVLEVTPRNAKILDGRIEFTATAAKNEFLIEGEWTEAQIDLMAATGAVSESWVVDCEGAFDCLFDGDVEKALGVKFHKWLPQPGQKLSITWKELGLLAGQSIVAEDVLLESTFTGKGLKQRLLMGLNSSAADQVYIELPAKAIPTKLTYGSTPSPILKNDKGLIHLTVSQGKKRVQLDWEIPQREGSLIPVPKFHLPIGRWAFWVTPNKNENAIHAGGMAGSPVVLFWPRMVLCLFLGVLFWFSEKKLTKKSQTNLVLLLILAAGTALKAPTLLLTMLALLAFTRFLGRVKEQRSILAWAVELGLLVTLLFVVGIAYFDILHQAFFSNRALEFEEFCSSGPVMDQYRSAGALCWESTILSAANRMEGPYLWVIPTMALRVLYFGWALVVGFFFFKELKLIWASLSHYVSLGRKPLFSKKRPPKV